MGAALKSPAIQIARTMVELLQVRKQLINLVQQQALLNQALVQLQPNCDHLFSVVEEKTVDGRELLLKLRCEICEFERAFSWDR